MLNNSPLFLSLALASSVLLTACGGESNSSQDTVAPILSNLIPNNNAVTHSRKVIITGTATDNVELKSIVINNGEQSVITTLITVASCKPQPPQEAAKVM